MEKYFKKHKIFFNNEIFGAMDHFIKFSHFKVNNFKVDDKNIFKNWSDMNTKIIPVINNIEQYFREIIEPKKTN